MIPGNADNIQSGHTRHADIEQNQIRRFRQKKLQGGIAVCRFSCNGKSQCFPIKQTAEPLAYNGLVICNEQLIHSASFLILLLENNLLKL